MQAQEVVKALHGFEFLAGRGFVFEGLAHSSYSVAYSVLADCPWHEAPAPIERVEAFGRGTTMRDVCDFAAARLGGLDAVDFAREIVEELVCPSCGARRRVRRAVEHVREDEARCASCGAECAPEFFHSLSPGDPRCGETAADLGLPAWEIVWARRGDNALGIELAGDRPEGLPAGE